MRDGEASMQERGRRAAVRAFLGMVALGAVYAVFNHRISKPDERRDRSRGRRR